MSGKERYKKFPPGRRSAAARCPRCKKIRKLWVRANAYYEGITIKSKNIKGEGKVCWLCQVREVVPGWRPGDKINEEIICRIRLMSQKEAQIDDGVAESGSPMGDTPV